MQIIVTEDRVNISIYLFQHSQDFLSGMVGGLEEKLRKTMEVSQSIF